MPHDAVIFDLDGTLVDTETLIFHAGEAAFAKHGAVFTRAHFARVVGSDGPTCDRLMAEMFPALDLPRINVDWDAGVRAAYADQIATTHGAPDVLRQLRAMRVPCAVATSSGRKGAARKLSATGLAPFFEVVITAEDVTRRKPAPDPYLLAAERLGVAPGRCLAFEDSAPGATSALAAGMTTVLVPGMSNTTEVAAHHRAENLAEGLRSAGFDLTPLAQT